MQDKVDVSEVAKAFGLEQELEETIRNINRGHLDSQQDS